MQVKLLDLTAQYNPIRNEVRAAIDAVCDAQAFILGPGVEKFEKNLAGYCGTKHAIGMSSGTDALICALMAIDLKPGDEVICPAFTFFATAGAVARLGGRAVFCDIDPETCNLDPEDVRRRITPRTKAIIPVHLFGQLADMQAINAIAAEHGLAVIEDAAQAIGGRRNGKRAGAFGLCGALSFFPSKSLGGFGDGGAICTDDDAFAAKCRLLRMHGENPRYYHHMVGGNFRLDALQAAILDVKLKYLEQWLEGRRRVAALYEKLLAGSKAKIPTVAPGNWHTYNYYTIRVKNRDAVKDHLTKKEVGCAVYYPLPLHLQKCFADWGGREGDLPYTEQAAKEVLSLPIYPELTEEQIRYVAGCVIEAAGS